MTERIFDHDRLDVYRLSIDYVASSFAIAKDLNGCHEYNSGIEYEYKYEEGREP